MATDVIIAAQAVSADAVTFVYTHDSQPKSNRGFGLLPLAATNKNKDLLCIDPIVVVVCLVKRSDGIIFICVLVNKAAMKINSQYAIFLAEIHFHV
jgi:hypothetical protein